MYLSIDIRQGGLGDCWMRIVSFYIASLIKPNLEIHLVVPKPLVLASRQAFSSRLVINDCIIDNLDFTYTSLGLRHLIPCSFRGFRFASPYGRIVIRDRNEWSFKDKLNWAAILIADKLGLVYTPPLNSLEFYQGYSEIVTLPPLRDIAYSVFQSQLRCSSLEILKSLQLAPTSPEYSPPTSVDGRVIVFPTGTGYQFIPLGWALEFLPGAVYAFFYKDPDLLRWSDAGLQTIAYYEQPGDILDLANRARLAISTDSFPSHFLQYTALNLVVLLTELPRSRVISPCFLGSVVDSSAPCHPCPHLERRGFPTCKAGFSECINWSSDSYRRRILELANSL
jgi:hypothetical protein